MKLNNKLLTYEDLALRWQLPLNTLRNWVMKKKLAPVKLGGRLVRFSEDYISELEKQWFRGK